MNLQPSHTPFFGDDLLLSTPEAVRLYRAVRDLPIVDYHCHLDENAIAENRRFESLGELWLGGDHYKWRAMRVCGVDERYITGDAPYDEKFRKFAEIFPKLCGNPLYYWAQLELKILFGITEPLNAGSADRILTAANERLKDLTVRDLLAKFRVEYIATTDDPASPLAAHGTYGSVTVAPTFRPDGVLSLDPAALERLKQATGRDLNTLDELKTALAERLDFFVSKGCRVTDHGMDFLPAEDPGEKAAAAIYANRSARDVVDKTRFFAHLLRWLAGEYQKRGLVMQLHFGTCRNVNSAMFGKVGRDAGFDVMRAQVDADRLAVFLDDLSSKNALPRTVLYSLEPSVMPAVATVAGAFPNVRVGAAWWFNDTVAGIRRQLETAAEYTALGVNLGMLTDSRSFSSYARFDFFRRILADFVGGYAARGEYDETAAETLMRDVCYCNVKEFLGLKGDPAQ